MTSDEIYLHNRRMEDKFTKKPTIWELAQTFSDCRMIAETMAFKIDDELKWYENYIEKDELVQVFKNHDPLSRILKDLKRFLRLTEPKKLSQNIDIPKAKSIPIQELFDFKIKHKYGNRIQAFCPFHDEKNPSFYIFLNNNRFHCFSCSKCGDSIDFVQEIYGLNFVEAVKKLGGDNVT